jgi:ABC-2 type transport system ATP-binding protein
MSILTCLFPPTEGTATVGGYDVLDEPIKVKEHIGYMPENISIYTDMVVSDYLSFVAEIKGIPSKRRKSEVDKAIASTELGDVAHRGIGKLSRGYLQRVGIAQALVGDPPVLILDEPTIGLDPMQIIAIRKLIESLAGQRTIILCSHILPEVSQVCKRVIIINRGELVAVDTPGNLQKRLVTTDRLKAVVSGDRKNVEKAIAAVSGVKEVNAGEETTVGTAYHVMLEPQEEIRAEVARAIVGGGFDLMEFRSVDVSLEEIFINLVTEERKV